MKKPFQARQGDVLITETKNKPAGELQSDGQPIILAHGEVTGHCHKVSDTNAANWWKGDGEQYVRALVGTSVVHQEHGLIPLEKRKIYKVRRQSQYAPEEIRSVAD